MVTKSDTGYMVLIETAGHPAEEYVGAMQGIIESVQTQNPEYGTNNFHLLELLKHMLPTIEQAETMFEFRSMLNEKGL